MTQCIRLGTMLIADGTRIPKSVLVGSERYSADWSSIIGFTSAQLDRELEKAGWTFFYMAGQIRTRGFGFNDKARTDRAITHVIDAVKRDSSNCLEITEIRRRSFLGLPYTSVVAHARHIQKSHSFYNLSNLPARVGFRQREPLYQKTVPVQNQVSYSSKAVDAWEDEGGSLAVPVRDSKRL